MQAAQYPSPKDPQWRMLLGYGQQACRRQLNIRHQGINMDLCFSKIGKFRQCPHSTHVYFAGETVSTGKINKIGNILAVYYIAIFPGGHFPVEQLTFVGCWNNEGYGFNGGVCNSFSVGIHISTNAETGNSGSGSLNSGDSTRKRVSLDSSNRGKGTFRLPSLLHSQRTSPQLCTERVQPIIPSKPNANWHGDLSTSCSVALYTTNSIKERGFNHYMTVYEKGTDWHSPHQ
jgi:hypothetical protein